MRHLATVLPTASKNREASRYRQLTSAIRHGTGSLWDSTGARRSEKGSTHRLPRGWEQLRGPIEIGLD